MKQLILDFIYPIGSVYISVNESFNPNVSFGGSWEQEEGGYALVSTKGRVNTGYEMSSLYADNHIPGQRAMGGLPNIYGAVRSVWSCTTFDNKPTYEGALQLGSQVTVGSASGNGWRMYLNPLVINANRSSTLYGSCQEGSSVGRVIPDHLAVMVWRRTA